MATNGFTILDDTNSNITYTGAWALGGTSNEFNNTTHGATAAGAQASVKFYGTFIELFGTIGLENPAPDSGAVSTYIIDNDPSTTSQFTSTPEAVTFYKQVFYTSPLLNNGDHVLLVTNSAPGKNPLWVDYFRTRIDDSSAQPQLTNSSSPTTVTSQTTVVVTASASASSSSTPSSSPILSTGAIAGIVVGSCVALLLVIIIIILARRISRDSNEYQQARSDDKALNFMWRRKSQTMPAPAVLVPFDPDAIPSQPQVYQRPQTTSLGDGTNSQRSGVIRTKHDYR